MRSKILSKDYKEELANIAEQKGYTQEAGNLLLSMIYKIEDSFENYETVKREVPNKLEFMKDIIKTVAKQCAKIEIAEPNTKLAQKLKDNKCNIISEKVAGGKVVISFPNEKTLLYGISKAGLNDVNEKMTTKQKAVLTAISIGKCISISEVLRDFNGWTWYISSKEIESSECNIIYILLSLLYGYKFINSINSDNLDLLKMNMPESLWNELEKVAMQFYLSYDKEENEKVLKELAGYKTKLARMKDQEKYIIEIGEEKKLELDEIRKIDRILSDQKILRTHYLEYNSKLPNEEKIFSVSHYEDMLQKKREEAMKKIEEYNAMQNPNEFLKIRDELRLKIKERETKTDITKLQTEFLKCFIKKIEKTNDKKGLTNLIYQVRYLNFIPNCKMKLTELQKKLVPKAIEARVLNPISNNNDLDYRILAGIFESQVISLQSLLIKLSSSKKGIEVEIYDGDVLDSKYTVELPDGSNVQIKKAKKTKIFE